MTAKRFGDERRQTLLTYPMDLSDRMDRCRAAVTREGGKKWTRQEFLREAIRQLCFQLEAGIFEPRPEEERHNEPHVVEVELPEVEVP